MALRVLLADESSTIKRVMQLALQDYGVDVKSVPVGLDVLPMTKSFKPDIVFADVLLQKKSGYEVCRDLKNDPQTNQIPVVLMWSGFMEFDQVKSDEAKADRKIEKPFDADTLRQIVQALVPKTQENPVSAYLTFPKMPDFTEEPMSQGAPPPSAIASSTQMDSSSVTGMSFSSPDDIFAIPEAGENDTSVGIPSASTSSMSNADAMETSDNWSHQNLAQINTNSSPAINTGLPVTKDASFDQFMIPADEMSKAQVQTSGEFEEVTFIPESPRSSTNSQITRPPTALESAQTENLIREEARALIESICWKILPDIAERIVREEINKLLKDVEKNI